MKKVPVWVTLPGLHFSLWNSVVLGRVVSYLGKPLATDRLTAENGRLAYARVLVEMEIKEQPHSIPVNTPSGKILQEVFYGWLPIQCGRCKGYGHFVENCKFPEKKEWKVIAEPTEPNPEPENVVNEIKEDVVISNATTSVGGKNAIMQEKPIEKAPNIAVTSEQAAEVRSVVVEKDLTGSVNVVVVVHGKNKKQKKKKGITTNSSQSEKTAGKDGVQIAGGGNIPLSPNAFSSLEC